MFLRSFSCHLEHTNVNFKQVTSPQYLQYNQDIRYLFVDFELLINEHL